SAPRFHAGPTITVKTDQMVAQISTRGGNLVHLKLLHYAVSNDHPNEPFEILNTSRKYFFIAQSGLTTKKGEAPGSLGHFQAKKRHYQLTSGKDTLVVPLTWHGSDGRTITKTYIFHRGSFQIEMKQAVSNGQQAPPWQVG